MRKKESFDNSDRLKQIGITIGALRKMRGLSQERLAEKAGISRSFLSAIEAPGVARSFSIDIFYNIADALEIDPADLISGNIFAPKKKD